MAGRLAVKKELVHRVRTADQAFARLLGAWGPRGNFEPGSQSRSRYGREIMGPGSFPGGAEATGAGEGGNYARLRTPSGRGSASAIPACNPAHLVQLPGRH